MDIISPARPRRRRAHLVDPLFWLGIATFLAGVGLLVVGLLPGGGA